MNKAVFIVPALSAILLCGCGNNLPFTQNTPNLDREYSMTADITCGKMEAEALVTRKGKSDWEFQFTSPENLSGMKISVNDNKYNISLGSLKVDVDKNSVYTIVPEIISDCLDSISGTDNPSITSGDGILTYSTDFGGKKVAITATDTGNLISLKCPYHKLAVTFSENSGETDKQTTADSEDPAVNEAE